VELGVLDDVLDALLGDLALLAVAPPHGPLVLAGNPELAAGLAVRLDLVALLAPQTAGEAAWRSVSDAPKEGGLTRS
jgi:hypothetical protein